MTLNITCDGKPYRVIKKENAYVLTVSINNSLKEPILDLDSLNFDDGFINIKENLPNGKSLELAIVTADSEAMDRYRGLETLNVSFDDVEIKATL